MLQRLRKAAPGHFPCAQSVSRFVLAVHTYTERCRALPVYGSQERWSDPGAVLEGLQLVRFSSPAEVEVRENTVMFAVILLAVSDAVLKLM